jgi:hypothetical protein
VSGRRVALLALVLTACGGEVVLGGTDPDGGSTSSGGSIPVPDDGGGPPAPGGGSTPQCTPIPGSALPPSGTPVALAQIPMPGRLALDATNAYVASYDGGPLYRVPLDASGPVELHSLSAFTVAANTTTVYSRSTNGGSGPQGLVVGCAKSGCGGSYTTVASGQGDGYAVAADDVNVYWGTISKGGIFEAPVRGGPARLLASGSVSAIAVAAGRVYYMNEGTGPSLQDQGLWSVPVDGGAPTQLDPDATPQMTPQLAADCGYVYYAGYRDIRRVPLGGGAPTVIATGVVAGGQLAVDADRVYFLDYMTPSVASVPVGGGDVTIIAAMPNFLAGIAVDANDVYWTSVDGGTVWRLSK